MIHKDEWNPDLFATLESLPGSANRPARFFHLDGPNSRIGFPCLMVCDIINLDDEVDN